MPEDTPPTISYSNKKWIVGAVFFGYIALALYIFYIVGVTKLFSVLVNVNLGIYSIALACVIVALTFHALVWFQLLNCLSIRTSFRRIFVLNWVGVFVDNIIPGGWSGDLFKAYLLNKDPNVESGKAVASVVAKNMYEAIFALATMLFGVTLLVFNYSFDGSLLLTLGVIMLLLILPLIALLWASFNLKGAKRIVAAVFLFLSRVGRNRRRLEVLEAKVNKALGDYHDGMRILLGNPRMFLKPMVLSFFAWVFEVLTFLFVFESLGQFISIDKVIIVNTITSNVEGATIAGPFQIITTELYRALGVPFAVGASVALLGGVVVFLLKTGISYTAFHYTVFSSYTNSVYKKFGGKVMNKARKANKQNNAQEKDDSPDFFVS
jgi:uncharacterized protein (TIRG00374 family)